MCHLITSQVRPLGIRITIPVEEVSCTIGAPFTWTPRAPTSLKPASLRCPPLCGLQVLDGCGSAQIVEILSYATVSRPGSLALANVGQPMLYRNSLTESLTARLCQRTHQARAGASRPGPGRHRRTSTTNLRGAAMARTRCPADWHRFHSLSSLRPASCRKAPAQLDVVASGCRRQGSLTMGYVLICGPADAPADLLDLTCLPELRSKPCTGLPAVVEPAINGADRSGERGNPWCGLRQWPPGSGALPTPDHAAMSPILPAWSMTYT